MMELIETTRPELAGQLESKAQALLRGAFPDVVSEDGDYYAFHETPAVIMILQEGEHVIGHLCAYQRQVMIAGEPTTIGMIGGVAIAPDHRRKGLGRTLLQRAHVYFRQRSIPFSILFACEPRVYVSSGYKLMQNEMHFRDTDGISKTFVYRGSMYAELLARSWPNQIVDLCGPVV
jgi:predicted acetyltransferase